MAIEIVDLPTKNGDFLQLCKRLPEGNIFPIFIGHIIRPHLPSVDKSISFFLDSFVSLRMVMSHW